MVTCTIDLLIPNLIRQTLVLIFLDLSVISGADHSLLEALGSLGFCDITLCPPSLNYLISLDNKQP